MLFEIDALLTLWFSMYSLPGRFPLIITKNALLQLLSGVDVSSIVEQPMLTFILDKCSRGGEEFSVRLCREAVEYLGKAFVRGIKLDPDMLNDPLFLSTPVPPSINVVHFGLPHPSKQELQALYDTSQTFKFPISKLNIKQYWSERYQDSAIALDSFEHIWGLVVSLDTEDLFPDGFFEVSWLFFQKRVGVVLPNRMCRETRDLFWEHCVSMLPLFSIYRRNPTIIMPMNSEQVVVEELSVRLIRRIRDRQALSLDTTANVKPIKRALKSKLDKALAAALRQSLESLSGWQWKSGLMPPEITQLEQAAFKEGILEFSEEFLKFDWNASVDSDWNSAALRSFVRLFKLRVEKGYWAAEGITEATINNKNIHSIIKRKWVYLKGIYEKYRIRAMEDQESKDALEKEEHTRMKRARHVSRKKELFRMRLAIIDAHPEWNELWKRLVETLDVTGMSSDETDEDISSRVFWRIPQTWRNPKLTSLLQHVDTYYRQPDFRGVDTTRKGNMRRKRSPSDHPVLIRTEIPSEFYPKNFYNLTWLAHNRSETLVYLSQTWERELELPVVFMTDHPEEEESESSGNSDGEIDVAK